MGQKVHPEGLRLGIIKDWKSKWVAKKNFKDILLEDHKIRKFIKDRLYTAGISKIEIERAGNKAIVKIYTAKPGMIIGKKGTEVEEIRKELEKMTGKQILIEPREIQKPEIDAQLIAENIAQQIEKRVSYRWAMKKAMQTALQTSPSQGEEGAKGIKVCVSGRLQGAEIARSEWYVEGRVPLQTLRADIDYGFAIAKTTYGTIGVKVWVFKGEKI
ncbi:MAG: 30S ribosomal protein S3 [Candidatus Goldbacteria bacterium]|nr:30S ribosomal protein S3 [Candidatus Goldiibacteriota bacterium]